MNNRIKQGQSVNNYNRQLELKISQLKEVQELIVDEITNISRNVQNQNQYSAYDESVKIVNKHFNKKIKFLENILRARKNLVSCNKTTNLRGGEING